MRRENFLEVGLISETILSTSWDDSPLAEGRKKNKNQNQNVDPANEANELDTRFFGDETEPRGSHRCGNVHIPPITVQNSCAMTC